MWPQLAKYLTWQRELRRARSSGQPDPELPDLVPLSINLDLTTACNYACDHCIDWDILNAKVKHDDAELRAAIREMAERGMRSVILIGGGEPTLYPGFASFVEHLKGLDLGVAVVTNGGRNDRIAAIAPMLEPGDWVRMSLDSASNEVFREMHKPASRALTLDEICEWGPRIKAINPNFDLGYSFVITWRGAQRTEVKVVENIHEIEGGAQRARASGFDYISYKPFLERADSGSEIMDPEEMTGGRPEVVQRIRAAVDRARLLERPGFRVLESTNLRMLFENSWRDYTKQPRVCHMQALRQVLSPHGTFNCPAYRGVSFARIGEKNAYRDSGAVRETSAATAAFLDNFDASCNCAEVTCLYNETNWWLERTIESTVDLDEVELTEDRRDAFL